MKKLYKSLSETVNIFNKSLKYLGKALKEADEELEKEEARKSTNNS